MPADQIEKRRIRAFLKHAGLKVPREGINVDLLAHGGSDRIFYRVVTANGSFVVMTAAGFRHDIRSYIDVGNFLLKNGIGVPEIIAYDDDKQMVLLEDLGDDSLYELLKRAADRGNVTELYKKVLLLLTELQMRATPHMQTCNYLKHRTFGYEALRWETDYFIECFVKRFSGNSIKKEAELDCELHRLAATLAEEPRYFMHRDFQSQNIYIKEGRVRVIDFQTATRGLLQYDLASLLKDAYFELERQARDELLHFYIDLLLDERQIKIVPDTFLKIFQLAGLQRNMQALGAFAFLSMDKAKPRFLQYIPRALSCLQDALAMFPEFVELRRTVELTARSLEESKAGKTDFC